MIRKFIYSTRPTFEDFNSFITLNKILHSAKCLFLQTKNFHYDVVLPFLKTLFFAFSSVSKSAALIHILTEEGSCLAACAITALAWSAGYQNIMIHPHLRYFFCNFSNIYYFLKRFLAHLFPHVLLVTVSTYSLVHFPYCFYVIWFICTSFQFIELSHLQLVFTFCSYILLSKVRGRLNKCSQTCPLFRLLPLECLNTTIAYH